MSTVGAKKIIIHLDNLSKENKAKLDKAHADGLFDDFIYGQEISIYDETKKYTEEDMRKCSTNFFWAGVVDEKNRIGKWLGFADKIPFKDPEGTEITKNFQDYILSL